MLREQAHEQLREQQLAFACYINQGADEDFTNTIRANGLTGARRLGIYRHGVIFGLRDALSAVYEVVRKLVGDEFFDYLAEQYVGRYPSQTGNVHDYGSELAEFLSSFPGLENLPYLPDVARLEWHYHNAFHSPIGATLNIKKLSQIPESKYEQLTLLLSPCCRLLSSDFPILRIWQANQDENNSNDVISLDEGGVNLAIVREGKQIVIQSLEPAAFALLDTIAKGETFTRACEAALQIDPGCQVGQVLQDAVLNRMIAGFSVKK